jgi:hypothetical protein
VLGVFGFVFDWDSTQEELYKKMVYPLIESILNGFNATIFAYGQTGTGKTFTMEGIRDEKLPLSEQENRGIIPRTFEQIFIFGYFHNPCIPIRHFFGTHWSTSHNDLDVFSFRFS